MILWTPAFWEDDKVANLGSCQPVPKWDSLMTGGDTNHQCGRTSVPSIIVAIPRAS